MAVELSPRERETLAHIAGGQTTKEIAAELSIAESTVNWHVGNALSKLGASTRAEAVAIALRGDDHTDDALTLASGRGHAAADVRDAGHAPDGVRLSAPDGVARE